jgi:hypothetical protein
LPGVEVEIAGPEESAQANQDALEIVESVLMDLGLHRSQQS